MIRILWMCGLLLQQVNHSTQVFSLEGAWRVAEVQTIKADGTTSSVFPKESQVLFSGKFYSFCWTVQKSTAANWNMTDSVKLARINNSLINAGSYELKGETLTMTADFAMNPKFVGGLATYNISKSRDTLILSGTTVVSADKQLNPAYAAGSRFITKLLPL